MARNPQAAGRRVVVAETSTAGAPISPSAGDAVSPPKLPVIFSGKGRPVELQGIYSGAAAFLICSGPSLRSHDLALLEQRGILTMAVNNAATVLRPKLWCSVDDPGHFSDAIWRDPGILKFVPHSHFDKRFFVRNADELLIPAEKCVRDMPTVFGFQRNDDFRAERWLYEETFNWGNRGDRVDAYGQKGSRSVMYVALRLLFYLGVRRIFLLGCDFRMELGRSNYAFEQDRTVSSVRGNNASYKALNVRLEHLRPYLQQAGLEIVNCTPDSGLTAFPFFSFEQAIEEALRPMPPKILTRGMYDRADVAGNARASTRLLRLPAKAQGEMQNVSPTSPAVGSTSVCDVTAMLVAHATSLAALRRTWRAWNRVQKDRSLPVLFVIDARLGTRREDFSFLASDSRVGILAAEAPVSAVVEGVRKFVRTPWCLRIDSRDLERSGFQLPNLTQVDSQVRLHCWEGTPISPATDMVAALDRWWNRGRRSSGDAVAKFGGRQIAVARPLLVQTNWLRSIIREPPNDCAELTDEILLRYCAKRTGEPVATLSLVAEPNDFCPSAPIPCRTDARATATPNAAKATPESNVADKECNEFKALQRRGFKDYSLGHRRMYTCPISLLQSKGKRYRILDVGCGIGFGLEQMLRAGIVENYVGVEPVRDSFQYVQERFGKLPNVQLLNQDWLEVRTESLTPADYTFCIEVVEHLAPQSVLPFLKRLSLLTKKNLFLSTPSRLTSKHGTRSTKEWRKALAQVGFNSVPVEGQWTTLFICEPKK